MVYLFNGSKMTRIDQCMPYHTSIPSTTNHFLAGSCALFHYNLQRLVTDKIASSASEATPWTLLHLFVRRSHGRVMALARFMQQCPIMRGIHWVAGNADFWLLVFLLFAWTSYWIKSCREFEQHNAHVRSLYYHTKQLNNSCEMYQVRI